LFNVLVAIASASSKHRIDLHNFGVMGVAGGCKDWVLDKRKRKIKGFEE
jgi:hypothetical protein